MAEERSGSVHVLSLNPFTLGFVIAYEELSFKADPTDANHPALS
jgi:hypothetical protein